MFGSALYDVLKSSIDGQCFHFGVDAMPRLADVLTEDIKGQNLATVTLDWSAFDSHCPKWLLEHVWDILQECIDFNKIIIANEDGDYEVKDVMTKNTDKYLNVFNWVRKVFNNARLMLPNSEVYELDGCIPSGSYFT